MNHGGHLTSRSKIHLSYAKRLARRAQYQASIPERVARRYSGGVRFPFSNIKLLWKDE